MKIGVFLYLPPSQPGNSLLSGGLPRNAITTAVAMQRFLEHEVIVVVPKAYRETVKEHIKEMSENGQRLPNVESPNVLTLYAKLYEVITKLSANDDPKKNLRESNQNVLRRNLVRLIFTANPVFSLLLLSLSVIVFLTCFFWLSSNNIREVFLLAVMLFFLLTLKKLFKWTLEHFPSFTKVKTRISKTKSIFKNLLKRDQTNIFFQFYLNIIQKFSKEIIDADVKNLTNFGNNLNIDIWWNPSTLFEGVIHLRSPIVSTFADFLPLEFPHMFVDNDNFYKLLETSKLVCRSSARIVSLSNHVKDRHLKLIDSKFLSKTIVINPGPPTKKFEMAGFINSSASQIPAYESLKEDFGDSKASSHEWWLNPVVVAATQNRGPYKNLKNLILAIQNLNLMGKPTHLILTCRDDYNELSGFIRQNSCENVVQIVPNLSENQMSAVFASSSLAISASHFEASMPFTLHESISEGTPCLLADIPVTREAMSEFPIVQRTTLFDPNDYRAISDKISWALGNQNRLLALQRDFLIVRDHDFGWLATSKKLNSIFEKILEEGNAKLQK